MTEDKDNKKSVNWAGVAMVITAAVAAPGMLINTYFDYQSSEDSDNIQETSHNSLIEGYDDIEDEVDSCFDEIAELRLEIAELRGYVHGMNTTSKPVKASRAFGGIGVGGGIEPPAPPTPKPTRDKSKPKRPMSYDQVKKHVKKGEALEAK